jgi:HEAT repeat protein
VEVNEGAYLRRLLWVVLGWELFLGGRAAGQPPLPSSCFPGAYLGDIIRKAQEITVVRLVQVEPESRTLVFRKMADLKGRTLVDETRHRFPDTQWPQVLDWAGAERTAILFQEEERSFTCLGNAWSRAISPAPARREVLVPTASVWYVGTVEQLREAVTAILAGREVVIPVMAPSQGFPRESSPVVRDWTWGKKRRVCRIRASMKLAGRWALEEGKDLFVGWGSGLREQVPALLADLRHEDPCRRAEAAEDLGQIGPEARDALPGLRSALRDPEGRVRVFAAEALVRIDPTNEHSIPALLAALKDRDPATRHAAATALVEMGAGAEPALPALVTALNNEPEIPTREAIAYALGQVGPESRRRDCSVRDVVRALGKTLHRDNASRVRLAAVHALFKFGPEVKAALPDLSAALADRGRLPACLEPGVLVVQNMESIDEYYTLGEIATCAADLLAREGGEGLLLLAKALSARSSDVRRLAVRHLADLGPHSKAVVPALRKALADDDPVVREWAARVLLRIDRALGLKEGVPVLARLLIDNRASSAWGVAPELAPLGPEAQPAVPILQKALEQQSSQVKEVAVLLLGSIGPGARDAVPTLLRIVKEDDFALRLLSAEALVRIVPDAEETRQALSVMLRSKVDPEPTRAALMLLSVGDRSAAMSVLRRMNWKNDLNCWVLRALGKLGPRAASLLPALKQALGNCKDDLVKAELALAVWRIGRPAPCGELACDQRQEAIEVLRSMLADPEAWGRLKKALEIVTELGPEAAPLSRALWTAFKRNPTPTGRAEFLGGLGAIGPAAAGVAPLLEQELKTCRSDWERQAIAVALARLGKGRAAVPILLQSLEEDAFRGGLDPRTLRSLGSLQGQAGPAVPMLRRALRQQDRNAYLEAADALFRIDPEAAAREGIVDAPLSLGR